MLDHSRSIVMISPAHAQLMARYNRWQNGSVYAAADLLTEAQRTEHRGAFFGSIRNTLVHLIWADQLWLSRFTGKPSPWFDYGSQVFPKRPADSIRLEVDWTELKRQRDSLDESIVQWANDLDAGWLQQDLVWTNSIGVEKRQAHWMLVTHFFNHQTHHRGQVHCLLTGFGAKPTDTDIPWMPPSG